MPQPLTVGKEARYALNRRLGGRQGRSGRFGRDKNVLRLPEFEAGPSSPQRGYYTDYKLQLPILSTVNYTAGVSFHVLSHGLVTMAASPSDRLPVNVTHLFIYLVPVPSIGTSYVTAVVGVRLQMPNSANNGKRR